MGKNSVLAVSVAGCLGYDVLERLKEERFSVTLFQLLVV